MTQATPLLASAKSMRRNNRTEVQEPSNTRYNPECPNAVETSHSRVFP